MPKAMICDTIRLAACKYLGKWYGVSGMAVSYKKLFKMLIDRDMKKKDFRELTGISSNTVTKLANNENVTMEVIEKICIHMGCSVDEIVDIIPDDQVDENREKTVE